MKKDFTNFGFALFGGFVIFMLGLVFLATMQKVELTSDQYYEEELNFQEWKVKSTRARVEGKSATVTWVQKQLTLQFFSSGVLETGNINGKVFFYRPNAKAYDLNLSFNTDSGSVSLNPEQFVRGNYEVKIEWTTSGIPIEKGYASEVFFQY